MSEWVAIGRGGAGRTETAAGPGEPGVAGPGSPGRDATAPAIDLAHGVDTDLDGRPDTVVLPDPLDLVIAADTDRDGIADLLIRFGADGRGDVVDLAADPGVLPPSGWGTDPGWDGDWGWCTDLG